MSVAVVEKIFLLLETLARANRSLALKDLSETTQIPKPTAYRLMQTLQKLGYVVRADEGGTDYLLGPRIKELSTGAVHQQLKDAARPLMAKIHKATNETVNLGVREGLYVRYIEYFETTQPLRLIVRPAQSDSLFSTALGRAILSALTPKELDRLIQAAKTKADPAQPPVRAAAVRKVIAETIERGWAEEREETVQGVCCVAVSLARIGYPEASISVSVPSARFDANCQKAITRIFTNITHHAE